MRGFLAYDRLLEARPGLRGRVVFVAMLYGSRQTLPEYLAYANEVEQAKERFTESRTLLLAFDELKESIGRGRNVPTLYDKDDVLEFRPDGIRMGGTRSNLRAQREDVMRAT